MAGPSKGEFLAPPNIMEADEPGDALPPQEEFWRPPVRFGSVPVEKTPLGWDRRRGFRKLFPQVALPFQVVERVSFGHSKLEPNRLFWGDNLHVMRQLPSESIDLIYIDPPFFSGRQYNVIFGDQNELRSFSDIWEGGMPGYLIWLNARFYEMKRLLRKTGSIYVHCDWHASHYIKVELDKIFGVAGFKNEIVWCYRKFGRSGNYYPRSHDVIISYTKSNNNTFNVQYVEPSDSTLKRWGTKKRGGKDPYNRYATDEESPGAIMPDHWEINLIIGANAERIGYPTQKPEELLARVIMGASKEGDVIGDFFLRRWHYCGGGTIA